MKKFLIRTASAIVFAAILLGTIYLGKLWMLVALGFFLCVALFEMKHFVTFKTIIPYILIGEFFYVLGVAAGTEYTYRQWAAIIVIFAIAFLCLLMMQNNYPEKPFIFKTFALFYLTVPFILFNTLPQFSEKMGQVSYFIPYCLLATIWIGDATAYIIGSLCGKHPMAKKISPHKTWEGFFGGLVFVIITSIILSYLFNIQVGINQWLFWLLFCLITYLTGTLGDLFESKLKRTADIKDSGNLMPGHGGAFDRFDSFLLSVPCIIIFLLTVLY